MLDRFQLTWVPNLVGDVQLMVSELVTNACRYGGDAFPAGSMTLWHPNKWLILTVHDKNPYQPYKEWNEAREADDWERESGRGLLAVERLAKGQFGYFDFASDGDKACPGKVARVQMLLPDVQWPHTFRDPWSGRMVNGR